jgi:hypothetical protein
MQHNVELRFNGQMNLSSTFEANSGQIIQVNFGFSKNLLPQIVPTFPCFIALTSSQV